MTELSESCFGCGGSVKGGFRLCGRCQKLVGVGRSAERTISSQTVLFERGLGLNEEKLLRFIQKGLFFKSFVLAGLIVSIVLAHPGLVLLQTAAQQVCRLTSSCPLA